VLATTEQGQPAIISARFGEGKTILAGTYLGMASYPEVSPENDKFFINLIKWAGIERPFTSSHDGRTTSQVEVRLKENSNSTLVFVINHSETTEEIEVNLKINRDGDYRIRDVIGDTTEQKKSSGQMLRLKTSLERKQVRVWEVTL
jgi:beta-galactosidase